MMKRVHKMTSRDRQLIGIICGIPFGVVGMVVSGSAAWVINKVLDRVRRQDIR